MGVVVVVLMKTILNGLGQQRAMNQISGIQIGLRYPLIVLMHTLVSPQSGFQEWSYRLYK